MAARDAYGEWPSPKGETPRLLSTVVLMGMGEPLYNYDNVARAVTIADGRRGHRPVAAPHHAFHLRRGADDGPLRRELGVNLAVSLHAVRDDLRDELVPLNRKYPLRELIAACRRYPAASNARRITFEYVMLKGINDSEADARELIRLIAGIPAKVNLIPFNPWPGSPVPDQLPEGDRPLRQRSSTTPASPPRSAPRAAATSSPPAANFAPLPAARPGAGFHRASAG